jgi:hypothetical protein
MTTQTEIDPELLALYRGSFNTLVTSGPSLARVHLEANECRAMFATYRRESGHVLFLHYDFHPRSHRAPLLQAYPISRRPDAEIGEVGQLLHFQLEKLFRCEGQDDSPITDRYAAFKLGKKLPMTSYECIHVLLRCVGALDESVRNDCSSDNHLMRTLDRRFRGFVNDQEQELRNVLNIPSMIGS